MESPEIISQAFQKLQQQDPENLNCFDCGSPNADHASTNHGIFLCSKCAGNHLVLGPSVSNIKSWISEPWTLKQLKLMSAGGNSAFHHFLLNYNISRETPIFALKYKTIAAEYYRSMLDALSENLTYDVDFPSVELGIQLINENSPSYSPNNEISAPHEYSDIPIQPPLAESIANVQVPPIENEEQPKGWKSWIKAKYTQSVLYGDKVVDKFNNFVSSNPAMKKIDEQGEKAVKKINEEVKKISQHPHVQYVENLAKDATYHLSEEAKMSYNYILPGIQKARNGANNFFIGIERETKKASSAAMNFIKNKRNQENKNDGEVQQPLLQNDNPAN